VTSGEPGKFIATAFALAGFAVALVSGSAVGNPATTILKAGLLAMLVCYVAGSCIGAIAQSVINQHLDSRRDTPTTGPAAALPAGGASDIGRSAEATS